MRGSQFDNFSLDLAEAKPPTLYERYQRCFECTEHLKRLLKSSKPSPTQSEIRGSNGHRCPSTPKTEHVVSDTKQEVQSSSQNRLTSDFNSRTKRVRIHKRALPKRAETVRLSSSMREPVPHLPFK